MARKAARTYCRQQGSVHSRLPLGMAGPLGRHSNDRPIEKLKTSRLLLGPGEVLVNGQARFRKRNHDATIAHEIARRNICIGV
jgi:hypothetical protein